MIPIPLGPPRPKPTQVIGVTVNDDWVVWMESPSTDAVVQPWVMYAYDRSSGATREVTTSLQLADGTPVLAPPGYTGPTLRGDTVVWAEVGAGGAAPRVDIVSCRVTACTRHVLLRGAAFPALTATGVYAVTSAGYRGQSDTHGKRDFHDLAIERYDFADGQVTTVAKPRMPDAEASITGLAAAGNTIAWTVRSKTTPEITILSGKSYAQVVGLPHGLFGYPVATNTFVAWAEDSGLSPKNVGGYVYSLHDHTVHSVGNTSGFYAISAAGRYLTWQETKDHGSSVSTIIGELP